MPNHVTTKTIVSGSKDEVQKFLNLSIKKNSDDKEEFDFQSIIPMPESLNIEESTKTELGIYHLLSSSGVLKYDMGFSSRYEEREITEVEIELGKQALKNIAEHGYATWYPWALANWGTKWNSYGFEWVEKSDSRCAFKFNTAWSFPLPIFEKLADLFPKLLFETVSFDEGWNFAGRGYWAGRSRTWNEMPATKEIYIEVYDREPELEDE